MKEFLQRLTVKLGLDKSPRLRKAIVGMIGTTIFLIGVALMVLPGPAFIVLPIGLAILATEFAWARRVVRRGQVFVTKIRRGTRRKNPA